MGTLLRIIDKAPPSKLRQWARAQVQAYRARHHSIQPRTAESLQVADGLVYGADGKRELSTRARMQRLLEGQRLIKEGRME